MRVTAFAIILFFLSLNLSLYLINESQILGQRMVEPYSSPSVMVSMLTVIFSVIIGSTVGEWILGRFVYGGAVGLILGALSQLVPIMNWIFYGFPLFLGNIASVSGVSNAGVTALIVTTNILMAAVWCWFILGFIGQRQLET